MSGRCGFRPLDQPLQSIAVPDRKSFQQEKPLQERDVWVGRLSSMATVRFMVQDSTDVFASRLTWCSKLSPNIGRTSRVSPFDSIRKSNIYCFGVRIVGFRYNPGRAGNWDPFNHRLPHKFHATLLSRAECRVAVVRVSKGPGTDRLQEVLGWVDQTTLSPATSGIHR